MRDRVVRVGRLRLLVPEGVDVDNVSVFAEEIAGGATIVKCSWVEVVGKSSRPSHTEVCMSSPSMVCTPDCPVRCGVAIPPAGQ